MTAISPKIEPRHLRLAAVVYVRQSTPQQLQNNQESTRRQYGLAERARQMGWPETAVRVIDDDLGMSGASSQGRMGFQRLVAATGMGEVGIVLVTEVSRLSRLNSDWHRVIELYAVFRTLIADEDGIYDAQNPNDRLLLGVKGTLFAAELHILQARMRGALLSKARRGELAVALPVGYRRRPDGAVVQDPDEAVRLAVAAVSERFAALGTARAVLRHFAGNGLAFPRLAQAGPEAGRIAWVRPRYGMIHRMLANPAYAGAFVYGRCRQEVSAGDPPAVAERRLPPEEWAIVVQGVYPGYVSYDTFRPTAASSAATGTTSRPRAAVHPGRGRPCCKGWSVAAGAATRWASATVASGRATSAGAPRRTSRSPGASRSWPGRSTRRSSRRSSTRCGRRAWRRRWRRCGTWSKSATPSSGSGSSAWSGPGTRRASPGGSTTPSIPRTGWWPASWNGAGRRRWRRSSGSSGITSACGGPSRGRWGPPRRPTCAGWRRTCPPSGTPTRPCRSTASACCGW